MIAMPLTIWDTMSSFMNKTVNSKMPTFANVGILELTVLFMKDDMVSHMVRGIAIIMNGIQRLMKGYSG